MLNSFLSTLWAWGLKGVGRIIVYDEFRPIKHLRNLIGLLINSGSTLEYASVCLVQTGN